MDHLKALFFVQGCNGLAFFPNSSIIPRTNTSRDTRSHTLALQVYLLHALLVSIAPSAAKQKVLSSPSIAFFKRACYSYVSN